MVHGTNIVARILDVPKQIRPTSLCLHNHAQLKAELRANMCVFQYQISLNQQLMAPIEPASKLPCVRGIYRAKIIIVHEVTLWKSKPCFHVRANLFENKSTTSQRECVS